MTNEDIERKCLEYSQVATPSYTNGDFDRYAIAQAFEDGAEWRINSVWHDTSERPKIGNTILFANLAGGYELTVRFADSDWEMFCGNSGLVRWAYIEDLIPDEKGGER